MKKLSELSKLPLVAFLLLTVAALHSCIEDGMSTAPGDQPAFSVDTLDLGTVFSDAPTPTHSFVVYNRHDKVINISSIMLRDETSGVFRLNVDGSAGRRFSNIEIRPGDSIYVFVEATVPPAADRDAANRAENHVDFVTNGVTRSVVLAATGRDVDVLRGVTIDTDTRWEGNVPRRIYDSLTVAEGVTLTLGPGTELFFHDKAVMNVRGTLRSEGTVEQPVVMTGDRTDNVVADIPFDLMAGQWTGVTFHLTSRANELSHTVVKNMTQGIFVDSIAAQGGVPALTLVNCRVRNSAGYSLCSYFSDVTIIGSEISDAGLAPLLLIGGNVVMNHVTVANYYLFSAIAYPLVNLTHFNQKTAMEGAVAPMMRADIANCIFYGLGQDINTGDLTDTEVYIRRTLFKSLGEDDDHFISCVWDVDPLYYTVREDYIFDYRLREGSPAAECADPSLTLPRAATDFYGISRRTTPALGAFEYVAPE